MWAFLSNFDLKFLLNFVLISEFVDLNSITFTLRPSNIWIHTKVLGAGSVLIGEFFKSNRNSITRQLFFTLKIFEPNKNEHSFCFHCVHFATQQQVHNGRKFHELILIIWNSWISQKAAKVLNFCFIENILHNFPMPVCTEPTPKTFVCIQLLQWRRVLC